MMKKITALIIIISLLFSGLAGCSKEDNLTVSSDEDKARTEFQLEPADTKTTVPYRIAVVDVDPYEPASQVFYNFVERLRELDWISLEEMPFRETDEVKEMVAALAAMELGGLVEFDPELCYYMLYEDMDEIESSLREAAKSEEGLGLILGMGTDPGLFVKDLNLDVPLLVPMATDPVASGIIDSAQDSGNSNIWALVEPNPTGRQLKFYHNMIGMKKLGMVVEEDSQDIAAIEIYEEAAAKMGIEVVKKEISRRTRLEAPAAYYAELQQNYKDLVEKEEIDAFLLTIYV
ncbi:MAG: hypothetical protein PHC91_10660, partial [Eubacteriales bacterium]|nr:hypothetical protein [Eubacteriales bacterium]